VFAQTLFPGTLGATTLTEGTPHPDAVMTREENAPGDDLAVE